MPPTHSSDLLESHETNKTVLTTVAPTLSSPAPAPSPSPPNPLLSRIKLKPARKPKPKSKKALVGQVAQAKASELAVIDAGGAAGGEEAEVLDLADQLLEQLEAQDSQNAEAPATSGGAMHIENATVGRGGGEGDSGGSTKDKLHELKEDLKEKLRISGNEGAVVVEKKVSRQQARKLKKSSRFDFLRSSAQAEVEAENDQSIQEERKAIGDGCAKLGVHVKEIEPDGHCLYSAIADQANFLGLSLTAEKENYATTRSSAASYMRSHPDEFLPFLTSDDDVGDGIMTPDEYARYCDMVERTAEWGGQPEILALSKHFNAPIHILQAGTDLVKVGDDVPAGRGPILISYHRKLYGLGEHYNSLRP